MIPFFRVGACLTNQRRGTAFFFSFFLFFSRFWINSLGWRSWMLKMESRRARPRKLTTTDGVSTTYTLQGFLAYKKQPPPLDHRKALGIVLL